MDFVSEEILNKGIYGKDQSELFAILGEPSCEYPYKKGMCQLYLIDGKALMVDIVGGIVRKVEQIDDRRESPRIVPPGVRISYIRAEGFKTVSGQIIDMSEKSILFRMGDKQQLPSAGVRARVCTNIESQKGTRVYLSLSGEIMSVGGGRLLVLLNRDLTSMSYVYLATYIKSMEAPNKRHTSFKHLREGAALQLIKSDYCMHCEDKLCGI